MLNRVRLWIRSNLLRKRFEREMREEMAEHIERSVARLVARGLDPEEARREAAREFGNMTWLQEEGRYARGTMWLDALVADGRFAVRHFARNPFTTVVMFVVLVVGMSISTLLFSYAHSYATQPPVGIAADDDLVRIRGSRDAGAYGRGFRTFSEDEFVAYRGLTNHFESVAGWTFATVMLDATGDDPLGVDARGTFVTENYFSVLGVQPAVGRGLPTGSGAGEANAAVAVLGYTAWQQFFGGSQSAIGSTMEVNGVPVTIVGVAPERFNGVAGHTRFQLWLPQEARQLVLPEPAAEYRAVGRLAAGVSMDAATAAVEVVAARIAAAAVEEGAAVETVADPSADVVPLLSANGDPMFDRDVRLMSLAGGLLGLLVLLVTCTNVSALLTGLASARRQEVAIRLSLGAPRSRVIRQLLTESAVLAILAGGAALGVVWAVLRAVTVFLPFIPMELGVTWPATTFTFGIALTVGILFGLSPALHATRLAIATAMRDSSGAIAAARARLQRGLVMAQIAFTQPLIVLLAAVLLLIMGNNRPQTTELGDRLVTLGLRPASSLMMTAASPESLAEERRGVQRLMDRVTATPGVEAAVVDWTSLTVLGSYSVVPEDRSAAAMHHSAPLVAKRASEGFFRLQGIPVIRGREFTAADRGTAGESAAGGTAAAPIPAVVAAELARRLWPGADPLGRRLQPSTDSAGAGPTLEVVGVIEDPKAESRHPNDDFRVWLPPHPEETPRALLIRTAGPATGPLLATLRLAAREAVPEMTASVRTIADIEERNAQYFRIVMSGVLVAGLMALLLSAIGLYAVIAFSVGERTREIAVRMAVGGGGRQIVGKFVADGIRLSAWGLAFGLPLSLFGLHALMTATGEEFPTVTLPQITVIAALGVLLVATAAAWIPARRAAGVDPAVTLRSE